MDYRRVIPCLDVKNGRLVKGVNFVDIKDVGDPAENAAAYSEAGADELVFLDITATVEGRKTMIDVVKKTIEKCTIPLTVGGGVGSLPIIEELLSAGASKVGINTAAVKNPEFVKEASAEFGSGKITIAIDTKKNEEMASGFELVVNAGTKPVGIDAVEWAKRMEDYGAGALLPTSMDADGTLAGYDIPMTKAISDAVSLPVIASGGAGTLEHLVEAVVDGHADAVLVASIAHFGTFSIREMKEFMKSKGLAVNL
ncbi:MAG TPA: imidazole glycerol phosphate synthase subunit HisF [Spirochaetota bacterium]|nr:imidazole glycerol phosphate synthase subunit HisF [Spirochaetota bacterium]